MSDGPALPPGCRLVEINSIDSTNAYAKAIAAKGAPDGTVVWALEQTAGRGRHGRTWISPHGNLYMTAIFRPDCPASEAMQLGFVTGVALAKAVQATTGLNAVLKWPNDLLVNGAKAAGILLESAMPDWVVVGVGLNVVDSPARMPEATSLAREGAPVAVAALLESVLAQLFEQLEAWKTNGFEAIRSDWTALALPAGSAIRVRLPEGELAGHFSGIDGQGSLLLETGAGTRRIDVGDVFPAPTADQGTE